MNREDMCFKKALKMVELGLVQLSEEMDIFQFTDLLIKLEEEKEYKNQKTDNSIEYNDEIVGVKEVGVLETIDISVSGDNLFYCNDILTKNSFGLPATSDFMFALISTEQMEQLNQIMVKQLKNRYNDPTLNKRFIIGIDRQKMRLYDVEQSVQASIHDSGQQPDKPLNRFGEREESKSKFKTIKV